MLTRRSSADEEALATKVNSKVAAADEEDFDEEEVDVEDEEDD